MIPHKTTPVYVRHLQPLMYYFGAKRVVAFLKADDERELLDWIEGSKQPTNEQAVRLKHAYDRFTCLQIKQPSPSASS